MPQEEFETLLQFFKAVADETRLKLLGILATREHSVEELAALLQLKAPTVSHHLAKLKEINAVALIGDYTREDDAITAELKRFGRAGVPLVLVYPADPKSAPLVLPEVLTSKIVLDAIEKAAPKGAAGQSGSPGSAASPARQNAESAIDWQPWSAAAVARARAAGKPVLVDSAGMKSGSYRDPAAAKKEWDEFKIKVAETKSYGCGVKYSN